MVNPMLLEPQDVELFFRLHQTLMFFVNQRLNVIPVKIDTPAEFAWAILDSGELHGEFCIHLGDDSEFVAKKKGRPWRASFSSG